MLNEDVSPVVSYLHNPRFSFANHVFCKIAYSLENRLQPSTTFQHNAVLAPTPPCVLLRCSDHRQRPGRAGEEAGVVVQIWESPSVTIRETISPTKGRQSRKRIAAVPECEWGIRLRTVRRRDEEVSERDVVSVTAEIALQSIQSLL
ncbi:hypothetical protein ANCDUO_08212 [Ancylostoma duodenale]|uniref:Uncharacterized protein n=1 Tax=Ancylostoma duodenale TaxID=51022 RepID=A0A0C2DGD5_9BILA|nr:hypothetical protein ANCDUO_08212 [Ancylostoma duodenale]